MSTSEGKSNEKNKGGKPKYWTDELIEVTFKKIIERICDGESVRSILDKSDRKKYPCNVTFLEWVAGNEEFMKQYDKAMEIRADKMFDDLLIIADNQENDVTVKPDGTEYINHNVINRNKLQIDTRKWSLSRMNPKKYGDKQAVDVTTDGKSLNSTPDLSKLSNKEVIQLGELQKKAKGL